MAYECTYHARRPDLLEPGVARRALQQLHEGPHRDIVVPLPLSIPLRDTDRTDRQTDRHSYTQYSYQHSHPDLNSFRGQVRSGQSRERVGDYSDSDSYIQQHFITRATSTYIHIYIHTAGRRASCMAETIFPLSTSRTKRSTMPREAAYATHMKLQYIHTYIHIFVHLPRAERRPLPMGPTNADTIRRPDVAT